MTTYGPAIQRGVSELWRADRDRPVGVWDEFDFIRFRNGDAMRFPSGSPISIVETWNQAHPDERPFDRINHGRDSAPADWDGERPLMRNGCLAYIPTEQTGRWNWEDHGKYGFPTGTVEDDIVAYRSKPASATLDPATYNPETHGVYDRRTHVALKIINEVEAFEWRGGRIVPTPAWLRELGIIRPEPTQAERIASETGLTVDQVQAVLDAQGKEEA